MKSFQVDSQKPTDGVMMEQGIDSLELGRGAHPKDEAPETTHPNPLTFYVFMGVVSTCFFGISIGLILLQERLVKYNDQIKLEVFIVTAMLIYAYIRLVLHVYTLASLRRLSNTFARMPVEMQQDTTVMLIDVVTNFLWFPLYGYAIVRLLQIADAAVFFYEVGPMAKLLIATYTLDRVLQLAAAYQQERFIHHACCCLWSLLVFWWFPSVADPSILTVASMEVTCKPVMCWFACLRFCLGLAMEAKQQGKWTPPTGIDRYFVPPSIKTAIWPGRLFHYYRNFIAATGSVFLLILAFMIRYRGKTALAWQIATPCLAIFFNVLDIPIVRKLYEVSKAKYWEEKVFLTDFDTSSKMSRKATFCTQAFDSDEDDIERAVNAH